MTIKGEQASAGGSLAYTGGVFLFTTASSASSYRVLYQFHTGFALIPSAIATAKVYAAARFAVTSTPTSTTDDCMIVGSAADGDETKVGAISSISTGFYSAKAGSNTLISDVPITTAKHTFEMFFVADNTLHLYIDGVSKGTVAYSGSWTSGGYFSLQDYNRTAGGVDTMAVNWWALLTPDL
jgi:hypothetical protein